MMLSLTIRYRRNEIRNEEMLNCRPYDIYSYSLNYFPHRIDQKSEEGSLTLTWLREKQPKHTTSCFNGLPRSDEDNAFGNICLASKSGSEVFIRNLIDNYEHWKKTGTGILFGMDK